MGIKFNSPSESDFLEIKNLSSKLFNKDLFQIKLNNPNYIFLNMVQKQYLLIKKIADISEDIDIRIIDLELDKPIPFFTTSSWSGEKVPIIILSSSFLRAQTQFSYEYNITHELVHAFDFHFDGQEHTRSILLPMLREGLAEYISNLLCDQFQEDYDQLLIKNVSTQLLKHYNENNTLAFKGKICELDPNYFIGFHVIKSINLEKSLNNILKSDKADLEVLALKKLTEFSRG